MFQPFVARARDVVTITVLIALMLPFSTAWAETPVADPPTEIATEVPPPPTDVPPPPTEVPPPPTDVPPPPTDVPPPPTDVPPPPTEVPTEVPLPTDVPVEPTESVVPTEPVIVETPTATEEPAPTETIAPTATVTEPPVEPTAVPQESTPTATTEVTSPDSMVIVGEPAVVMDAGESLDITVRYTLGSSRASTTITAQLTEAAAQPLVDWSIAPVNRADTLNDPNRITAQVVVADVVGNGDMVETTWRVTAPAHIETPLTILLSFESTVQEPVGESTAVAKSGLVSVSAQPSAHAPTLSCTSAGANTWNCAFDTTHPDSIVMQASATVPAGWELKLNGAPLTADATALDAMTVAAGSLTIAASYPLGCPDVAAIESALLSLSLSYPSGDLVNLSQQLPLAFSRPSPTLSVQDFAFTEFNQLETLTTTGTLTLAYADAPCAWQANLQITDLHSDTFTVSDAAISIVGTEGLPDATISITDGTITILAQERPAENASGTITIHLQIVLPHQVPPGAYVIGVLTEIALLDGM